MHFTLTEMRLYGILRRKMGTMVPVADLDRLISCKDGMANLRTMIWRMRRKGIAIKNIRGRGYILTMPVIELDIETQYYAQDVQDAIHGAMRKHAENVGFEAQVAIIGVAIGAILHQLPEPDRGHFVKILLKNVRNAPQMSEIVRMQ